MVGFRIIQDMVSVGIKKPALNKATCYSGCLGASDLYCVHQESHPTKAKKQCLNIGNAEADACYLIRLFTPPDKWICSVASLSGPETEWQLNLPTEFHVWCTISWKVIVGYIYIYMNLFDWLGDAIYINSEGKKWKYFCRSSIEILKISKYKQIEEQIFTIYSVLLTGMSLVRNSLVWIIEEWSQSSFNKFFSPLGAGPKAIPCLFWKAELEQNNGDVF